MQGPVISILVLQTVFCTTSGLSLGPSTDLTLQSFSLICDFDGALWTSSLQFSFNGSTAGGCGPPPNPVCGSTVGNITRQAIQNATLTLDPSKIQTHGTALWQCTHAGLSPGEYNATVIAVCSDGEVEQNGDKVDIRCSCGFPSVKATLKYKMSDDNKDPKVVDLQSSTGNNCIDDSRAMDFLYKEDISPGIEELCVSFTTLSQISESKETCRSIDCRDPLLYGLLPVILIVLLVSIIIIFIMIKKLPEKIHEKLGDVCKGKILIIILFNTVAIGIGLALGLGLRNGQGKCDNWELALGLSLLFGVLLSVILIISILCKTKKGNEDDGVTSDRSNGDRARSPASASAVKVTEKKPPNMPTEKGTEASYLNTKPVGHPLSETPNVRKNQLEPIKPDNGEVENSAPEKKKKKKKKKKREASEENENRSELQF